MKNIFLILFVLIGFVSNAQLDTLSTVQRTELKAIIKDYYTAYPAQLDTSVIHLEQLYKFSAPYLVATEFKLSTGAIWNPIAYLIMEKRRRNKSILIYKESIIHQIVSIINEVKNNQ